MRQLIFLAVVLAVLGTVNSYLYLRLVGPASLPVPWRWAARIFLVLITLATPLPFLLSHYASPHVARLAAWPVFVWTGLMFLLLALCVPTDVMRFLVWLGRLLAGAEPLPPERLLWWRRTIALAIVGAAVLAAAGGVWNAHRAPAVRRLNVEIDGLPSSFDGFTIAQLTDLHVGLMRGRAWLEDVVDTTNGLKPDLVAVTGDLVDVPYATDYFVSQLEPLAGLRARRGRYFVTGNHEYYGDTAAWLDLVYRCGFTVLGNRRVDLGGLCLAGVVDPTDPESRGAIARTLAGRNREVPVVLLAHQPKVAPEAADHGVDLMLSGHTHGGQIWPFRYFVTLQTPYVAGRYEHEGTTLYVSQGTGFWGPPMRVFTRSEITLITLRSR